MHGDRSWKRGLAWVALLFPRLMGQLQRQKWWEKTGTINRDLEMH